ncbi:MAG: phosphatidylinositol kinase [Campylobacteraceae bacterium]|nr:phosphatidylinositol kinase [Campylobacteraceae bacterium]
MKKFKIKRILTGEKDSLEQLGTKAKFWFYDNKIKKLFKEGRKNTGENWVEVVVSELCIKLDIPHAKYEFSEYEEMKGTITENFVPSSGRLVLGNELLAGVLKDIDYDSHKKYGLKEYNLSTVLAVLKTDIIDVPINYESSEMNSAFDVFVGYIMLDCLISNPDRHHENWGLVVDNKKVYLTPTYDHASGLGCREPEERKKNRLISSDNGFKVDNFVNRAKTPFYLKKTGKKLSTYDAFIFCSLHNKKAALYWLKKLSNFNICEMEEIFSKVPNELISEISVKFAMEMLRVNKKRLIKLIEESKNGK